MSRSRSNKRTKQRSRKFRSKSKQPSAVQDLLKTLGGVMDIFKLFGDMFNGIDKDTVIVVAFIAVSYTHLTLPTILLV